MRIEPISCANLQDFLSLFDETTCSDCYCTALYNSTWKEFEPLSLENRKKRVTLVEHGVSDGYLFYEEDELIGWVQVANIASLQNLINVSAYFADATGQVVTCFKVKPEHRRRGFSVKMIGLIVDTVNNANARLFAIPTRYNDEFDECRSWTGTVNAFAKNGFVEIQQEDDDTVIMERITAQEVGAGEADNSG